MTLKKGGRNHICAFCFRSEDDPFLIAAAVGGGKGVKFVSNDVLRQHIFKLETTEVSYTREFCENCPP